MPTNTTNYSLQKPLVNSPVDEDLWGSELNDDLDDIDTLLRVGITIASQSSQTSNFAADASISVKKLYPCDATGGAFNATIPAAATAANGATIFIKKTDASANAITLLRTGADTLDGATSLVLSGQNSTYGLVSNGVDAWYSVTVSQVANASTTVRGIIELATAAETLTGSDAERAITPDAFAGNKSLGANGYYKFPGGMIMQWGTATGTTSGTVNFPTPFATACYSVVTTATTETLAFVTSSSTTAFNFGLGAGGSRSFYWQAIGV